MAKKKETVKADKVLKTVITPEVLRKATQTLKDYKAGKAVLEERVIENERWWRLRHWESIDDRGGGDRQPASGWLFNSICNKHADAMDSIPMPNILPREETDKETAKELSAIVPLVLEQNEFEETFSDAYDDKLVCGTGIIGVFWDQTKLNGLGDISIVRQDVLNIFWEPGIEDIQESKNVFSIKYVDNDIIKEMYPEVDTKGSSITVAEYEHDDYVDRSNQSVIIDWYYHKNGLLHFVKYIGEQVIYATEDDPELKEKGLYDHGKYPFVFDPCYRIKGSPCGFGQVDVSKSAQERIDRLQQAIDKNAVLAAKPRFFRRQDSVINIEQFADSSLDFVDVTGNMDNDSLRQIEISPLPSMSFNVLVNTIDELKETSGNRDFSQGSTAAGVTSGAAIAALQEAGTKLSRDMQKRTYRSFKRIVLLIIELIRQFYDEPRRFRITGPDGHDEFVTYDNAGIKNRETITMEGDTAYSLPTFDVSVSAEKESPFARMSQNDLALQLYQMQFFVPQNADAALACLQMMTFDGKDEVTTMISANRERFEQEQMAQAQMMQQQMMAAQMASEQEGANDNGTNNTAGQPLLPEGQGALQ